jgi:putative endonuclease
MKYQVYILYSQIKDHYYIGQTQDLGKRLEEHNRGKSKSTKSGIPWELKYLKEFQTRGEAMEYENKLKRMKSRKYLKELIKNSV